jgi:hypothetical protein
MSQASKRPKHPECGDYTSQLKKSVMSQVAVSMHLQLLKDISNSRSFIILCF